MGIFLAILAAVLASYSQILLKKGSGIEADTVWQMYCNHYVCVGYIFMLAAMGLNILAYTELDYMLGNILNTLTYLLVILLARLILKEKIQLMQYVGMIFILMGITLYHL